MMHGPIDIRLYQLLRWLAERAYVDLLLVELQPDATVCRYLFTAKLLYMFRVPQHSSSRVLKAVTAASGTGHNTGAAISLQRGLMSPRWREVAAPVL